MSEPRKRGALSSVWGAFASSMVITLGFVAWWSVPNEPRGMERSTTQQVDVEQVPNTASLPFDVSAIMERAHFAYRTTAPGVHRGGHVTYQVDVDADGTTLVSRGDDAGSTRPTLRIGSAQLHRGDRSLDHRQGITPVVTEDGHVQRSDAQHIEHWRNHDHGVEQSWSFERAPEGSGDLRVTVAVHGLPYVGATNAGLHFADANGHGFRYGHATWIDAAGARTAILARHTAGTIELRVPGNLVDDSRYPVALDPIISPEIGTDQPVPYDADGNQTLPRIASNGSQFLMVWQDDQGQLGAPDVYASRVALDGTVIDRLGLAVAISAASETGVSVTSNGTDYLVAWVDTTNGDSDVRARRITSAGQVLDGSGIPIATSAVYNETAPDVTARGTGYLVVWEDQRNGDFDVYGARVGANGNVVQPGAFLIAETSATQACTPSVASNGIDFLVTWTDQRNGSGNDDIYAARVAANGAVIDVGGFVISAQTTRENHAQVASNGSQFLVAWNDFRNNIQSDIYAARVREDGSIVDTNGFSIRAVPGEQSLKDLTSDGTTYYAAWVNYFLDSRGDVWGSRIEVDDTSASAGVLQIANATNRREVDPSVAAAGGNYLVLWEDSRAPYTHIYGARVTAAGVLVDRGGLPLSTTANRQDRPLVASNGSAYLVAWTDRRMRYTDVYAVRVSSDGVVLDPNGIRVTNGIEGEVATGIAVAGNSYWIAWNGNYNVYVSRVSSQGVALDPAGIHIAYANSSAADPRIAYNGTNLLVTWADQRGANVDIYGARMATNGTVTDAGGFPIVTTTTNQWDPDVASAGGRFLVAWQEDGNGWDVRATLVDGNAPVGGPNGGFGLSTLSTGAGDPSVASNGSHYFVAWMDRRTGASNIVGARVSNAGAVLDTEPIVISSGAGPHYFPRVAVRGDEAFVTWQLRGSNPGDYPAIQAARLRAGALVGDVLELGSGALPRVAAGPLGGSYLAVMERFRPEHPYGTWRTVAHLVRFGARGEQCAIPTDCESGHCVDGVCCEHACGGGDTQDCVACSVAAGASVNGTCGARSQGAACDDNLSCTVQQACAAGECVGVGSSPCFSGTACIEQNPGTACSACPTGTWSASGTGVTPCALCNGCGSNERVAQVCTATSNTVCEAAPVDAGSDAHVRDAGGGADATVSADAALPQDAAIDAAMDAAITDASSLGDAALVRDAAPPIDPTDLDAGADQDAMASSDGSTPDGALDATVALPPDAATPDATVGPPDASTPLADASAPDGAALDAATDASTPPPGTSDGTCGCTTLGGHRHLAMNRAALLLLGLSLLLARRRLKRRSDR